MTRSDFEKLVGLEKRRIAAMVELDKMNGHRVRAVLLTNGDLIETPLTCEYVDTALRQHYEDDIDVITRAMHQLGVEGAA